MNTQLYAFILVILMGCQRPPRGGSFSTKQPTPRDIWTGALSDCANDDLLSRQKDKLLFLGISNVYGPGSCWRSDSHNYEPRWPLTQAVPNPQRLAQFITPGVENPCSTTTSFSNITQIETLIGVTILPVSLTNTLDISKAKSITGQFSKWRKDNLNELFYEEWIKNKDESGIFGKDLQPTSTAAEPRLVMKTAIWVEGFKLSMVFNKGYLDTLEANGKLKSILTINNNLMLKRTFDNKIEFNSANGFYIVATLKPINGGAFGALPGGTFKSEQQIPSDAKAINKPSARLTDTR